MSFKSYVEKPPPGPSKVWRSIWNGKLQFNDKSDDRVLCAFRSGSAIKDLTINAGKWPDNLLVVIVPGHLVDISQELSDQHISSHCLLVSCTLPKLCQPFQPDSVGLIKLPWNSGTCIMVLMSMPREQGSHLYIGIIIIEGDKSYARIKEVFEAHCMKLTADSTLPSSICNSALSSSTISAVGVSSTPDSCLKPQSHNASNAKNDSSETNPIPNPACENYFPSRIQATSHASFVSQTTQTEEIQAVSETSVKDDSADITVIKEEPQSFELQNNEATLESPTKRARTCHNAFDAQSTSSANSQFDEMTEGEYAYQKYLNEILQSMPRKLREKSRIQIQELLYKNLYEA